jgi:isochorismate synthase
MNDSIARAVAAGEARPAGAPVEALLSFAERVLRRPRGSSTTLMLTLPLEGRTDVRGLLRSAREGFAWWSLDGRDHPEGAAIDLAVGSAAELRAEGSSRFAAIRRAAAALFRGVEIASFSQGAPVEPRLFGGFSFHSGSASAAPWQAFADARFVLPRLWLRDSTGGSTLTAAFPPSELARRGSELIAGLERVLELVAAPAPRIAAGQPTLTGCGVAGVAPALRIVCDDGYRDRVAAVRDAVRAGAVEKVVAARRVELELADELPLHEVVGRLETLRSAGCRFAMRFGTEVFLGATPERLVARRGPMVFSEALAGSCGDGDPGAAERLLASPKERHEHDLVVRHVAGRLRSLCSHLDWPSSPRLARASRVSHLHTPVRGLLRSPAHVLDLAAALHPTPAVGGVPIATAANWIARREPHARGWYASPIGWFDRAGDGELEVALRSALLAERRAFLWAGAGIVAGSDPEGETRETELKLGAMLGVLGAELPGR